MLHNDLIEIIEIYENERIAGLGVFSNQGFTKDALLLTDRGHYSTKDGSKSFNTIEEATKGILPYGWAYTADMEPSTANKSEANTTTAIGKVGQFFIDTTSSNTDNEGWTYDVDFGTFENSCDKKGMVHFVRRRRLYHEITFDPDLIMKKEEWSACDNCDSILVDEISTQLLESLACASLLEQAGGITEGVIADQKRQLLEEILNLEERCIDKPDPKIEPYYTRIELLLQRLRSNGVKKQSVFSKAANLFHSKRESLKDLSLRTVQTAKYFSKAERDMWAALAVRHNDPEYEYHCDKPGCGVTCDLFRVPCENVGCKVVLSRRHIAKHDDECAWKVVCCPRECGDSIQRQQISKHLNEVCALRDAVCPFAEIGCSAVVLHKDVPDHMKSHAESHLLLALDRMMEYQKVFQDMTDRISKLEQENKDLKKNGVATATGLATAMAALEATKKSTSSEMKSLASYSKKETANLRTYVDSKLSSQENFVKREFQSVNQFLSKK